MDNRTANYFVSYSYDLIATKKPHPFSGEVIEYHILNLSFKRNFNCYIFLMQIEYDLT